MRFDLWRLAAALLPLTSVPAHGSVVSCVRAATEKLLTQAKVYTGGTMSPLDPESYAIFNRVYADPEAVLTTGETEHLTATGNRDALAEYRRSNRLVRALNQRLALLSRSSPKLPKPKLAKKALGFWKLLLPVFPDFAGNRATKIFGRFAENPAYVPTASEELFLAKQGLKEDLARFKDDLKIHQAEFLAITRVRRAGTRVGWAVTGTTTSAAVVLGSVGHDTISVEESLDETSKHGMSREDDALELIVSDSASYPVSVRIGGVAWVFSRGTVARARLGDLMQEESFRTSHTRVRFEASLEEKRKLREHLEEQRSAPRLDLALVNTDLSNASRALGKVLGITQPVPLDRSSALYLAAIKVEKALNPESRIGKITVAADDPEALSEELLRLGGTALDAYLHATLSHYLIPASYFYESKAGDR